MSDNNAPSNPAITAKERRKVRRIMHLIYRVIRDGEWRVSYERIRDNTELCRRHDLTINTVGFVDEPKQVIYVDHREESLSTTVHEFLHVLYPKKVEDEILALEALVMKHMSRTQARNLHQLVSVILLP